MTAEREELCGLCGYPLGVYGLGNYTHHLQVGEVHDGCMVAFWYGLRFQKPDGSVVVHNKETCGFCNMVYVPLKEQP